MDYVNGQAVVELKGMGKTFKDRQLFQNFNLTVMPGEFLVVMGSSGSGKSTLLNIIGLLDKPDPGSIVRLFGEPAPDINSSQARRLLRSRISYIFQNAALIDQDSVEANLKLAQRYSAALKEERAEEREAALLLVGLAGTQKQKVYRLSGGEQQRLALACMHMRPSELILADEPTGSLDPKNRDVVMEMLQAFNQEGKTLIVVTHDQNIARNADRIVSINEGRIDQSEVV